MQPLWITVWSFLRKLKMELSYDPAIPVARYMSRGKKTPLIWKDTWTSIFMAAWFTIPKIWKQPKCPSTDEVDLEEVVYIYNRIILSHKKWNFLNEILPFATTWMDLECIMLSEICQRQILYVVTYMWKLKNKQMNITKQKQTHR